MIEIKNDLFDVAWRLKAINGNYAVYYNTVLDRFEVHDLSQRGCTLAFVSPYNELDCRTVDYALKTRVQNADCIFAEIERGNAAADRANRDKLVAEACRQLF